MNWNNALDCPEEDARQSADEFYEDHYNNLIKCPKCFTASSFDGDVCWYCDGLWDFRALTPEEIRSVQRRRQRYHDFEALMDSMGGGQMDLPFEDDIGF